MLDHDIKDKINIKMSSMITGIQYKLLENHDQLKVKNMILPYFVSLQFPEKQRRLVHWWANIIQHAIRYSNEVYLSPSDLELVFTMHNLKPVPLRAVLQTISESGNFEWRQKKSENLVQPSQSKIKQFIASVLSAIIPQKSIKSQLSNYKSLQKQQDSKIISVVYMRECLQKVKEVIKNQLQFSTCIAYNKALTAVRQNLPLSMASIKYLIKELDDRLWLLTVLQQNEIKFLIISEQPGRYKNQNWVQIQKSIYNLNEAIEVMTGRLQKQSKAQKCEVDEAKQWLLQKNQKKARNTLQMVKMRRTKIENIEITIKALRQHVHLLQMSQNNTSAVQQLQKSNKLLKTIQIEGSRFDDILQQNMEIQQKQRQANHKFQELNQVIGNNQDQDIDIMDLMMKELETEVKKGKQKQKQKQRQKNMRPSGQTKQNQQRQTDKNI